MILVFDEELDPAAGDLGESRILAERRRRQIGRDALARGLHIGDRRNGVGRRDADEALESPSSSRTFSPPHASFAIIRVIRAQHVPTGFGATALDAWNKSNTNYTNERE